ncbi:thiamine biosynthesis protein ThiS [Candidatus Woesearchaeota archaeon]|jgi:sulfur carrier protein ThiS|nr:thiamine biosynthesis protein ThiS [Candidatus Woesearchaeota archaeon]MBT7237278.1 thiamine biosynthesis protein ThiS [Candidatus Woesearchaeota archaeon]
MVKVYVDRIGDKGNIDVKSVKELVDLLGINLEEYIIVKNGELVNQDVGFESSDEVKFLSVVSGG